MDKLIELDFVCTNDLILSELGPKLIHQKRGDIWESLYALELVPHQIDWKIIREYQVLNLQNGVKKVGIPDLIILQQLVEKKLSLFTFDKHFKLMQEFIHFDLLTD